MTPYPVGLKIVDEQLQIEWSDGQVRRYTVRDLRAHCPCAGCRESREPATVSQNPLELNVLSAAEARPLGLVSMKPVGNYAYSLAFSDGHDAGIYTFALLRELGSATP